MFVQMCFPPTSHPPPHNSCALEPSMLFEPIHLRFTDSLFQCYSQTQYLIHHIHKSYKSYFLLFNIGPGKLHRVSSVILFQNNSSSYLESSNCFSIIKTDIKHLTIKKKKHFHQCSLYIKKDKGTFRTSWTLKIVDSTKKNIGKNLHFNRKLSIV